MMDWTQAAADLAEIVADNQVEITPRRGGSTLAARNVRIARLPRAANRKESAAGEAAVGDVVVVDASGAAALRPADRFNDAAGLLYEVTAVRPNREAAVIVEAKVIQ